MSSYKNSKRTRLSGIYHNIKTRCTNPNYDKYSYYGGKGISICKEWYDSYEAFEKWAIENGYDDTMTIDRIDVDGNYTPENCRWVSRKTQANNRTNNRLITYKGVTKTLAQWSEWSNINYNTLRNRLKAGWSVSKTLSTPADSKCHPRCLTYNGETLSIADWSRKLGTAERTISRRLARGWSVEKTLSTPILRRG